MGFLIPILLGAKGLALRALGLLRRLNGWQILCIVLLCLALLFYVQRNNARGDLESARTNLNECREGRKQDRAAYEQAQRDAKAKNEAEVKRIEQEQDRISANVESDLRARLERLRRELRSKSSAPGGAPNRTEAGPDGKAPGGADGQAGVCLAPEELLRAAENEERHDQLITWVERQLGVRR